MKNLAVLLMFFLVASVIFGLGKPVVKAETDGMATNQGKADTQKGPRVTPSALRGVCAFFWDRYYESEKIQIDVSTRGTYDETVVFTCPDCSLEEHFVNPFLSSEYQGKTGMDRIKECGYTQVVFKGARGLQEIVRQVP